MGLTRDELRILFGDKPLEIESAVLEYLASVEAEAKPLDAALASVAIHLAHLLDRDGGVKPHLLSKELCDVLNRIAGRHGDTDNFWEHFGSDVSTTLRDATKSGKKNSRT